MCARPRAARRRGAIAQGGGIIAVRGGPAHELDAGLRRSRDRRQPRGRTALSSVRTSVISNPVGATAANFDEVALYDQLPTPAELLAHYEANA